MLPRLLSLLLLITLTTTTPAGDWPGWRGPHGNGTADGTGYPVTWSESENLLWTIRQPGPGGSTPIVFGDNIYITFNSDGLNQLQCIGIDGEIRWTKSVGNEVAGKHKKATGANPSPVTDGERVFAYFKSGDLGCFSLDGKLLWQSNVHDRFGEVNHETLWWDLGNSPVMIDGALVLSCVQSGPSWLAAFNPEDGSVLWHVERRLDAPREANQSYATPTVVTNADGSQTIIVLGADHVTAHSAEDGRELWRVGGLNPEGEEYYRSISSPVAADGIVLAPYARGGTLTAIRLGGNGDVTNSHVVYTNTGTSADVPTPAILGDRVFICRDADRERGTIDCLDLKTGEEIWSGQLPRRSKTYSASPVVADGKLYVTREDGTVFVVDALADEFTVLAENQIADEFTVATPVFVDGKILLRSQESLRLVGLSSQ